MHRQLLLAVALLGALATPALPATRYFVAQEDSWHRRMLEVSSGSQLIHLAAVLSLSPLSGPHCRAGLLIVRAAEKRYFFGRPPRRGERQGYSSEGLHR
jgi:hypothetical protein